MATARSKPVICNIVEVGTLRLETKNRNPLCLGVAVMKDKLLVTNFWWCNLQIFNLQDGKLICTYRLESEPWDVCVLSDTEFAVCMWVGKIVIMTLTSNDGVERVKTLYIDFLHCQSLTKWTSDKLIVSGLRRNDNRRMFSPINIFRIQRWKNMLCWAVVWIKDGRIDSTHNICEGHRTHMTVKQDTVYVSCLTRDFITNGVHAFDLLNPRHELKFLYQHQELTWPWSIMADSSNVYVGNGDTLHQITDSGQLVTIHKLSSYIYGMFYDDQLRVLYTSQDCNEITSYKMEYPNQAGFPLEILNMDARSIQRFEEALKDGKETVYNIRIMVVGHIGVGKTTLVKRILGEEVHISERDSTQGIDVYVNCCDVSLSTYEWIRQAKDSEQDYKLQRLVRVLNKNYQTRRKAVEVSTKQRERTYGNPMRHVADDDKHTEVLYHRSQQQNEGPSLSSTFSLQRKPSSTKVQSSLTQSERNTMPELVENVASDNFKTDPIREMLNLLQQNPNKTFQHRNKYAHITMLDFAGQYAYYTTHQMFLSRRAIYLLVSNTSKKVNDLVEDVCYFDTKGITKNTVFDLVEIWMNSIHSCAPPDKDNLNFSISHTSHKCIPPPVILVGTHIDQIPKNLTAVPGNYGGQLVMPFIPSSSSAGPRRPIQDDEQAQREICRKHGQIYLKELRSYLSDKPTVIHLVDEDFAIDNTVVDSKVEDLKMKIVEVASQQPYWGEQIPTRWFPLEQHLMKLKEAGVKVISRLTVENLNKEETVQIKDTEELNLFLTYLHETGTIIYFSIEVLRDNIVLDPKWLIDALKSLINAQPVLPNSSGDNDITQKWTDFKEKGILTLELVEAIWTKKDNPELHEHKKHVLKLIEQFNIIARVRSFDVMGMKEEDYFLAPCMLCQEAPAEVMSPEQDPRMVTTPEMCCIFTGKYLPTPIFHRLLAACVARWPVAKKETSEHLIFCGCCVFDLDLHHRLTVYIKSHVVHAKITRLMKDEMKAPDAKLCSKVRRFITLNLTRITSYLGQNLQYELHASDSTWHADQGYNPDPCITLEHMNHQRLSVALVTVCGNAIREILCTFVPAPHADIYQAILANKSKLTSRQGRPLLNSDQIQLVFPDPQGTTTGKVDHFDLSLLYTLIRNVSSVPTPSTGWGCYPLDHPRDRSLGASVERIRSYRNNVGHSTDGKLSKQAFDEYLNKMEAVLDDIEHELGSQGYRAQLEKLKGQVVSVFKAS